MDNKIEQTLTAIEGLPVRMNPLPGDTHRLLREGEIVQHGDEVLDDNGQWRLVEHSIGRAAPDPSYTAHCQYRRRLLQENNNE
jgi:hypothetical protein